MFVIKIDCSKIVKKINEWLEITFTAGAHVRSVFQNKCNSALKYHFLVFRFYLYTLYLMNSSVCIKDNLKCVAPFISRLNTMNS